MKGATVFSVPWTRLKVFFPGVPQFRSAPMAKLQMLGTMSLMRRGVGVTIEERLGGRGKARRSWWW